MPGMWVIVMIELLTILYFINVQIFIKFNDDFNNNKDNALFKQLKDLKLDIFKFMDLFRKIIFFGGFTLCIVSLILFLI